MSHDVFICHSSQDRTLANAIVATLEEHGIRCWIAPRDVVPGLEYAQSIIEAIGGSRLTVLVFSANANSSPHVRRELERTASHGIPILPFRVEDVLPAPSVEYFISDAHWLDAMTPPMEQHLNHLVGTVRLLLDRQVVATGAIADDTAQRPLLPPPAWSAAGGPSSAKPPPSRRGWIIPVAAGVAALALVGVLLSLLARGGDGDGTLAQDDVAAVSEPTVEADLEFAGEFMDGFDVGLRGGWYWENEDPGAWRVVDGRLEIDTAPSPPIANVLVRPVPDAPFSFVSTLVRFQPDSDNGFAGIVLTGTDPDSDRIQFGRAFCDDEGCVGDGLYLEVFRDGALVESAAGIPLESTGVIFLGLELHDDVVVATYSYDGREIWNVVGTAPRDGAYTRVGLIAHQAPTSITAAFDHVSIEEFR